ncbi:gamma-glutamyltransferase [Streptomyces sp. B93]|uniref:gamma-glutamyltransferase n=1 Tax=Streptomyces sp. B93 TaxID=2824875 RepID=UPI001B39B10C|nr:gamma-glutamyltransferase [Streptomyces sp. B93]MBQ1092962.1 gamma-glutamyltransferase [Streptomyces sp. B93]
MRRPVMRKLTVLAVSAAVLTTVGSAAATAPSTTSSTASGAVPAPEKTPVAVGHGGAVASVDADASAAGIEVLGKGGNAVDAAVATAAALGVTEPYSAGIGGGGYFVYYDASTRTVHTIDGRETAPLAAGADLFLEDGRPIPFAEAVSSGLSVGVPGTPATWRAALDKWGSRGLGTLLKPAERLARDGFTVDETFRSQTAANETRFRYFPDTAELFLPGGELPVVGSVFRNPDLARTYRELGKTKGGVERFYRGAVGREIVRTVNRPPVNPGSGWRARGGELSVDDLASYRARSQAPSKTSYRGFGVYSMAPSSSGGTTVGEALNILEGTDLSRLGDAQYLHRFIEASRIAFADRGRWVGDPAFEDVPTEGLLSQEFADSRACLIKDDAVLSSPVAPGDPRSPGACGVAGAGVPTTYEGESTTHLTVADKWGNVVSYTLTIEQTGGSGITVPGRGFLLNNELTDFSFAPADPAVHDPNLPGPGKRPRSSMAPTIVLDAQRRPVVAVGSPGGATIITTVIQTLTGVLDRGLPLVDAIAAPRASQRNGAVTDLEGALYESAVRGELEGIGHSFRLSAEIGAATGVQRLGGGKWLAAAETVRRGGGAAMVVRP